MKKINFGKGWEFSLNGSPQGKVDIPHDFSICQERNENAPSGDDGGYFPGGYGVYKKTFVAKKNRKYFFMSDGAFGITEVFLNENLLLINKYGYNSFYVELSDYLRYDKENTLVINVNNKWQPNARWYTGSGLYRDVYLCECTESYLDPFGPFVYTEEVFENDARMGAEVRFFAEKSGEGAIDFEIFEDGKRDPVVKFTKYIFADKGENKVSTKFQIRQAKIWDLEKPSMYSVRVTLRLDKNTDTESAVFGVRTVYIDSEKGLLLNGKSIKLRGGCVHHDHGPIGSCVYADAEYRRIAKLKEAGFNSVRCSHNPQSPVFYDACDRLGILVIDELFDYWTEGKRADDFHMFFGDMFEEQIDLIVRKNRCHPSIIMWSTGNEIPQKAGHGYGYRISRQIADGIRSIDTSRPITHALCGLWDKEEYSKLEKGESQDFGAEHFDFWADRTKIVADTTDIIGYNYAEERVDKDLEKFPQRVIMITESFPLCAYTTTKQINNTPRLVGDFVWTAWDYFGETGLGHISYEKEATWGRLNYPNHIADCGDFDICGKRKPQSYYREISWGLRKDPYIIVKHPKNARKKYAISGWGFYDGIPSWNWHDYEGAPIDVCVFAECDELILEINGKEVARQSRSDCGVYKLETEYHSGEICAKAAINGKIVGSITLKTEDVAEKIGLMAERDYLAKGTKKPDQRLIYVDVAIEDKNGALCTRDNRCVSYEAEGADIIAVGSTCLTSEEQYITTKRTVNNGKALVILKKHTDAEKIILRANTEGLPTSELVIG
ncbi:MAG: DUF4982 domain-containing protein [Clostridia bacterium]|nr:DUF4982 domain-containing protein [Clostridia bacterium]